MQITVSAGVAVFNPLDDNLKNLVPKQLVDLADKALYISKRNGRNRVTVATSDLLNEQIESK